MVNKHAYLLMLHHRLDLVDLLLDAIDDERNDIYIHIDPRCREFSFADLKVKNAHLYETDRIEVNWGGYSQIECELLLMKAAKENGPYVYYHLLQGSSYPLKSQDELHDFYNKNSDKEYIEINETKYIERVEQIHLFNENIYKNRLLYVISELFVKVQKLIGYNHFKKYGFEYKKGFALWSITDDFLSYVLSKEELIKDMMKYSICGDEIYLQVLAYNSDFKNRLNNIDDKYSSSLWASTWPMEDKGEDRKGHNFNLEDYDYLITCNKNFARKFEGPDGIRLIEKIRNRNK